jgi:hypothetical protein
MSLILSGTDGLSDVDGSASTPAIRGTDTNTGIFFPAADTIAFAEGGAEVARFDSSGRLGIGNSATSPSNLLTLRDTNDITFSISKAGVGGFDITNAGTSGVTLGTQDPYHLAFKANNTERMRISSSGVVGIGQDASAYAQLQVKFDATTGANNSLGIGIAPAANTSNAMFMQFYNATGNGCGSVTRNGTSNAVLYNTSSDYRLKENIAPMTGALAKVQALKPVTWTWIDGGQTGEGFIAHEVQEIVPSAVSGDKDAIGENGKPKYQGMDSSYLVATLTAAIQELKAELDSVKAELATLKA